PQVVQDRAPDARRGERAEGEPATRIEVLDRVDQTDGARADEVVDLDVDGERVHHLPRDVVDEAQVLFDERVADRRIAARPVGLPQRCGVHRLNPQSWGIFRVPAVFGAATALKSGPASRARTAPAITEPK